jgi:hypothetical protein
MTPDDGIRIPAMAGIPIGSAAEFIRHRHRAASNAGGAATGPISIIHDCWRGPQPRR